MIIITEAETAIANSAASFTIFIRKLINVFLFTAFINMNYYINCKKQIKFNLTIL